MNIASLIKDALLSKASKVTLQSSAEEIVAELEPFGFNDVALVDQVMKAARLVATDPTQSIQAWIQDGGLLRLIAGVKPGDAASSEQVPIQCPHCTGIMFLEVSP